MFFLGLYLCENVIVLIYLLYLLVLMVMLLGIVVIVGNFLVVVVVFFDFNKDFCLLFSFFVVNLGFVDLVVGFVVFLMVVVYLIFEGLN